MHPLRPENMKCSYVSIFAQLGAQHDCLWVIYFQKRGPFSTCQLNCMIKIWARSGRSVYSTKSAAVMCLSLLWPWKFSTFYGDTSDEVRILIITVSLISWQRAERKGNRKKKDPPKNVFLRFSQPRNFGKLELIYQLWTLWRRNIFLKWPGIRRFRSLFYRNGNLCI